MGTTNNKKVKLKRVPAIDKCFKILELLAGSKNPRGITEISNLLTFNKSTVFNIINTLEDLCVLECTPENKVRLGIKLYTLGLKAGAGSFLISKVHPYLEEINQKTKLSVFLGIRSSLKAVIVDKVDSPYDFKVSSDVGMKIPLIATAAGKVLMSQLPETQIDKIFSKNKLIKFTPSTCTNVKQFKNMVKQAREDRFALDDEEYIEGFRSAAIPLNIGRPDLQAAIWIAGLKSQLTDKNIPECRDLLKRVGERLENQFYP